MPKNLPAEIEEALVASAKSGDELAFEALAENYKRVLEFHIRQLDANPSNYDDLFQEGLLGLLKAVRSYDASREATFATFASLCVKSSIISGVRKNAAQVPKTVTVTDAVRENETSPSAEEILIDNVRAKLLYDRVYEALSTYEKTVFDLYLSDMSYESIAFVTGKSVKSTSNAVFRIRNKLKQLIGNPDSGVPNPPEIPQKG
jgi:RNA polymerase sporulation-specific sigma factor